ncbi:hypothetical protein Vadar_015892 [Vaccinium darrowii]|uniref:Uncharacterized protein n=1 Tax=Vaccinium darrowii TaxID=229202 RepID=A0ACB7Z494_9ERIC|nr:hypothetical protein Vadar_015892 [Vaccinium darrowii]
MQDVDATVGIQFALADERAEDSPTAEDGLRLEDQIVKFGNVESSDNLLPKLASEDQSNQGHGISVVVLRQAALVNLTALYRLSLSLHLLRFDLDKKLNVTAIKLPDFGSLTPPHTFDDIGCIGSSLGRRLYYARPYATKVLIWMLCDASDWVLMHSIRTQDLINYELGIEGVPRDRKEIFRRTHESWATLNLKRLVDKSLHLRPVAFDSSSDAVIIWALGIAFWTLDGIVAYMTPGFRGHNKMWNCELAQKDSDGLLGIGSNFRLKFVKQERNGEETQWVDLYCGKDEGASSLLHVEVYLEIEKRSFAKMADPLFPGHYPIRGLYQALAVTAMRLQEQASTRPLIGDVVTALTYSASQTYEPSAPPRRFKNHTFKNEDYFTFTLAL